MKSVKFTKRLAKRWLWEINKCNLLWNFLTRDTFLEPIFRRHLFHGKDKSRIAKAITREHGRGAIKFFAPHTPPPRSHSRYLPAAICHVVAARRRGLYGFFSTVTVRCGLRIAEPWWGRRRCRALGLTLILVSAVALARLCSQQSPGHNYRWQRNRAILYAYENGVDERELTTTALSITISLLYIISHFVIIS